MTTDEFNRMVNRDIARMVARLQAQYDRDMAALKPKPEPCHCEAYKFPHRFDPHGYCKDFLPERDERDYADVGDYYEEMLLDSKHRAAGINSQR